MADLKKLVLRMAPCIFGCAAILFFPASAAKISPEALSLGGAQTRDLQFREVGEVFHPGTEGYLSFGINYFPLPSQTELSTSYGTHKGYIARYNFAGYFSEEIEKSGWNLGILWWFERHGWDSEDFLLFPHYGNFPLIRSVQTAGLAITRPSLDLGIAAGVQYSNPEIVSEIYSPESDSLYEWGAAVWGPVSLQTSFHHSDFRHVRLSLNMESKQVRGGHESGFFTYLPNIDAAMFNRSQDNKDSARLSIEQNIFRQLLYVEVTGYFPDKDVRLAALKYYPDPSKVVSFDVTCYKKENGDLLWGGGVSLPFIRLSYNHADDIENLFGLHGTFVAQIHFAIAKADGKFFGLNGSRSTPMETKDVDPNFNKKKEEREKRENKGVQTPPTETTSDSKITSQAETKQNADKKPIKQITAKGIKREKIQ